MQLALRFTLLVALWLVTSPAPAAELDLDAVAVKVGDEAISVRAVEHELAHALPRLPSDPAAQAKLRAAALDAVVQRRLALQQLTLQQQAATSADVALASEHLQQELQARGENSNDFLNKHHLNEDEYKDELRWRLSWEAYLKEQLTDKNLARYFDRHRREFDGTKVRVAHLLLKAPPDDDADAWRALDQQAREIRAQLAELTFAEAVRKFSQAPTADAGGDLGFIERRRPMPEAFSVAAFALEVGEVSPPVRTAFGVHLIRCEEVLPGSRSWTDARGELRDAVSSYLLTWLAHRRAETAVIETTGAYPHRDPVSGEIVPATE
jgi:parvulin-like peptidyl-prolyl isomerase